MPIPKPSSEPFYEGKPITIVTGFSTGSIFDLVARTTAQYWGKHVPGSAANIVVPRCPARAQSWQPITRFWCCQAGRFDFC